MNLKNLKVGQSITTSDSKFDWLLGEANGKKLCVKMNLGLAKDMSEYVSGKFQSNKSAKEMKEAGYEIVKTISQVTLSISGKKLRVE